jgi:cobalt-zinc-cadmium efflux system membrane fusion protein
MNTNLQNTCRLAVIITLTCVAWLPAVAVRAEEKKPEGTADAAKCEHNAAKAECFICTPALREKGRLWCKEHNRYEDRCWICHPEEQDKKRLYCKEHSLYEDECYLCHPELKKPAAGEKPKADQPKSQTTASAPPAADRDPKRLWCKEHNKYEDECVECHPELAHVKPATASDGTANKGLMCKEHNVPEAECGMCHPELAATLSPGQGLKVRLASSEAASKAGIKTSSPEIGAMSGGVEVYAEVTFNQNKLAQIVTPAEGIIRVIAVDLGSRVEEGTVLATITSAAIGEAKGKYLQALADSRLQEQNVARARKLQVDQVSSEKEMQETVAAHHNAGAALLQARQQLLTFGFDDAQIDALDQKPAEAAVLELRAPFAGEITERNAVRGALAKSGERLFTLADRSTMWAILSLPENSVAHVAVGQLVELRVDALGDQTFTGRVTWVATEVDDRTRMAKARVEVENPEGLLKARMFARARVISSQSDRAVMVPQSAIQQLEGKSFAFVKLENDLYEARCLQVGAKRNGRVEILNGLLANDAVVTEGGFIAKSQFLLSRLGAGCVDH